jgi:hypothetical protein
MNEMELESKFRQLEGKGSLGGGPGEPAASPDIDDEIAKLKKKIRIGS